MANVNSSGRRDSSSGRILFFHARLFFPSWHSGGGGALPGLTITQTAVKTKKKNEEVRRRKKTAARNLFNLARVLYWRQKSLHAKSNYPGRRRSRKKKREGQQHKNGEEYIAKEGNLLQVFAAAAESQLALTEEYYIHPVERIKNHKGIAQVCGWEESSLRWWPQPVAGSDQIGK